MSYLDTLVVPESEVPYPIWVPKHESRSGKNTGVVVGIVLMIVGSLPLLAVIMKKIIKWWDRRESERMIEDAELDSDSLADMGYPGGTLVETDLPYGSGGQLGAAGGPGDDSPASPTV